MNIWIVVQTGFPGDNATDRTFEEAYGPFAELEAKQKAEEFQAVGGWGERYEAVKLQPGKG